jgi:hypothetical protein
LWATGQSEKTNPTTVKGKKQKAKSKKQRQVFSVKQANSQLR